MTIDKAIDLMKKSFDKRLQIRIKKGKDYAGDQDCLQNFKKVALLLKILEIDPTTSYGVAMLYSVLKLDRLCNLVFRKKVKNPQNEPIEDSIDDLLNYIDLFRECLQDDYFKEKK
jgi:hypothetical protein